MSIDERLSNLDKFIERRNASNKKKIDLAKQKAESKAIQNAKAERNQTKIEKTSVVLGIEKPIIDAKVLQNVKKEVETKMPVKRHKIKTTHLLFVKSDSIDDTEKLSKQLSKLGIKIVEYKTKMPKLVSLKSDNLIEIEGE